MAVQLFVGPWPLFQFLDPVHSRYDSLGRGSARRKAATYLHTEQHRHGINAHNTDIHALSWIRTHDPSVRAVEDSSCLRPRGHCDRRVQHNEVIFMILSRARCCDVCVRRNRGHLTVWTILARLNTMQ
jgi:hypothetical protein